MGLFDSFVPQMQRQLRRGDEVEHLLTALLADVTDPATGGLRGFLDRFSAAGFSGLVQSWLNHDAYAIASASQIRHALGEETIARLAGAARMLPSHTASALAVLIPGVVYRLTPGGRVPDQHELIDLLNGGYTTTSPGIMPVLASEPAEDEAAGDAPTATAPRGRWRSLLGRLGLTARSLAM